MVGSLSHILMVVYRIFANWCWHQVYGSIACQ